MRILLKKGKQKELVTLAKGTLTWDEFSKLLNYSTTYLNHALKYELISLPETLYYKLCNLSKRNFDNFLYIKYNIL